MYSPPPQPGPGAFGAMRSRLRPMGVGDILDETFRLYRENFTLFVATVAVLEVPVQIITLLLTLTAPAAATATLTPGQTPTNGRFNALLNAYQARAGLTSVTTLIGALALAVMTAALAVAISQRYLDRPVTVGDAYRATMSRLGPLIVAILWVGVRFIGLAIACVVLVGIPFVIFFAVAWSLLSQVVMLENVDGIGASRRSRGLVRGYWWKTLGLFIVVGLLVAILGSIPSVVVGAFFGASSASLTAKLLVIGIVSLIVNVLLRPIQIIAPTLLFYDLKIRKEAFDLEAMAQQSTTQQTAAPPDYTRY